MHPSALDTRMNLWRWRDAGDRREELKPICTGRRSSGSNWQPKPARIGEQRMRDAYIINIWRKLPDRFLSLSLEEGRIKAAAEGWRTVIGSTPGVYMLMQNWRRSRRKSWRISPKLHDLCRNLGLKNQRWSCNYHNVKAVLPPS